MSFEIPTACCPTCDAICVGYQRIRGRDDHLQQEFEIDHLGTDALCDVLVFTCGAVQGRKGRVLFRQPPGGNGFVEYDFGPWSSLRACPEAERIVQELREEKE